MEGHERFVPLRVGRLTTALADRPWADADGPARFRALGRLVSALYHFEYHDHEQTVIDAWERIDDDPEAAHHVTGELIDLLDGANYVRVTPEELDEAFARESLVPLRLDVDLDDYDELIIYRRGSRTETVEIKRFKGLRTEERTITVEGRVVVFARVQSAEWFAEQEIDPADRGLEPGAVSLKQFRSVPRGDIKTLLPSTQVRFRPIDSVVVGVPAVVSGIVVLATKLLPTLGLIFLITGAWLGFRDDEPQVDQAALVALLGGVITLGGFVFRQWTKLKNRRVEYLKTLSETLFFRMLGDGLGVVHTLLSSAEEQEVIEVLLAYRFLADAPAGLTAEELDHRVEVWLADACPSEVDFEVDDALTKAIALGLVEGTDGYRAIPIADALAALDRRWDDLFRYQDGDPLVPTNAGAGQVSGARPAEPLVRPTGR